jgi:hypothetical protein
MNVSQYTRTRTPHPYERLTPIQFNENHRVGSAGAGPWRSCPTGSGESLFMYICVFIYRQSQARPPYTQSHTQKENTTQHTRSHIYIHVHSTIYKYGTHNLKPSHICPYTPQKKHDTGTRAPSRTTGRTGRERCTRRMARWRSAGGGRYVCIYIYYIYVCVYVFIYVCVLLLIEFRVVSGGGYVYIHAHALCCGSLI